MAGVGPGRRVRHRHGAGGRGVAGAPSAPASRPMSGSAGRSGVLAAALLTPLLLPVIGWRGMFALGVFPAVVAYFIRRGPARAGGVRRPRRAAGAAEILAAAAGGGRGDRRGSASAWSILCSVQNFGYYGVMIWLPSYLVDPVRLRPDPVGDLDRGHHPRHGGRHLRVRPVGRPHRPQAGLPRLYAGRRGDGGGLFATDRPDGAADRRRGDGVLRQRHAGRLRRADDRALSDGGAGDGAERAVQSRPRRRRLRPGGGRRRRRTARVRHGHRPAGGAVRAGHRWPCGC